MPSQPTSAAITSDTAVRVVATPGALRALESANQLPNQFLQRHVDGDWGQVNEHDRRANELALIHGERLLSAYTMAGDQKIWIITEADRSSTCLLLPEEY
jgi:hypothetical protein